MRHTLPRYLLMLTALLLCVAGPAEALGQAAPPEEHVLSAAYPNPFETRTQFSLVVPTEQHVEVAAYNVLGQRVRTLFAGRFDAGQKRTFVLDAEALPSGIYLYRARGETFTATRRVLLMR